MATFTSPDAIRWNIFARELEDVLRAHKLRLGNLDDNGIVLYREKVRRLQQSLKRPTQFPTLNPEEMDRLFATIPLTAAEQTRLRAALLATAIERILMDRIDPYAALMGGNDAFAIILEAMQSATPPKHLVHTKGGAMIDADDEQDGDVAYQAALAQIDRATLALHASLHATSGAARLANAHEAQSAFMSALEQLDLTHRPAQTSEEWAAWRREALQGRQHAEALLNDPTLGDNAVG